jgi:hypothetical protein
MQWSTRDKPMFQTVFAPSREEALRLLEFARYLWVEDVAEKVAADPRFAPSALWRAWAGQTFVGFSLEKMLLQGGHAFPSSIEVQAEDRPTGRLANLRRCLGSVLAGASRDRIRADRDPTGLRAVFKRIYPEAVIFPEHESWFARHPNPYFRCLEAYLLRSKAPLPTRMLEIGAGACVNVAFYHSLNRRMKSVVVDLPETMVFGYSFLRAVLPDLKILLSNEVRGSSDLFDADVVFLLPTQAEAIPDESLDFCFNMSSFQEMSITTVNHYLEFMGRKLVAGGRLVSVNQEVSRYLEGNALKNYDLSGYHSTAKTQPAAFGSSFVAHVPGLKVIHLEIEKQGPL